MDKKDSEFFMSKRTAGYRGWISVDAHEDDDDDNDDGFMAHPNRTHVVVGTHIRGTTLFI